MPERDSKQERKAPEEGRSYEPDQSNRRMTEGDEASSWGQPLGASRAPPARTKLDLLDEKREAERAAKQARDERHGRAT